MLKPCYEKIALKIRSLPLLNRNPSLKQLIKYSLVGNFSNLIDLSLYIYLTRFFFLWRAHYLIANLLTMFIAGIFRFIFHKHWTFRDPARNIKEQYLKFSLTLLLSFAANELVLFTAVEAGNMNDLIAKIISMAAGTLFVFAIMKKWVFKPPLPKIIERFRQWRKIRHFQKHLKSD